MTQAKKLKRLEKENAQLKNLVADLSLDKAILKEVLSKKVISQVRRRKSGQASGRCAGCVRKTCL